MHWTKDSQVIVNSTKVLHNKIFYYSLLSLKLSKAPSLLRILKQMSTQKIICIYKAHRWSLILYKDELQNWQVPKRLNFSEAFVTLSEPFWVCDLESEQKNRFSSLDPWFWWFFLVFCRMLSVQYKISYAKTKSWWWLLLGPNVCLQCVFWKILKLWIVSKRLTFFIRVDFFSEHSASGQ